MDNMFHVMITDMAWPVKCFSEKTYAFSGKLGINPSRLKKILHKFYLYQLFRFKTTCTSAHRIDIVKYQTQHANIVMLFGSEYIASN
jgi:hypothetical protein